MFLFDFISFEKECNKLQQFKATQLLAFKSDLKRGSLKPQYMTHVNGRSA